MSFDNAYFKLESQEGEYSNNPNDLGGETYKGIARNIYSDLNLWSVVDQVKQTCKTTLEINNNLRVNRDVQNFVKEFYKINYWNINYCNELNDDKISEFIFLCAVNIGSSVITKFFQKTLNALNYNPANGDVYFNDIILDGKMTAYEVSGFHIIIANRKLYTKEIKTDILDRLKSYVLSYYTDISVSRVENRVFTDGWNRKLLEA